MVAVPRLEAARSPGARAVLAGLLLAAATAVLVLSIPSVSAQISSSATVTPSGALMGGRGETATVWTGSVAYIFGGLEPTPTDEILQFDPATNSVTIVGHLPTTLGDAAAVWTGSAVYLFGGTTAGPTFSLDTIYRWDPATGSTSLLPGTLPEPRRKASAIWDGIYAYVFSGENNLESTPPTYMDCPLEIVRFDPSTGTAANIPGVSIPYTTVCENWGAAWTGSVAYLTAFGNKKIVQFDPASSSVSVMPVEWPDGIAGSGAGLWDGQRYYYVAGHTSPIPLVNNRILVFDPSAMTAGYHAATIPWEGLREHSAFFHDCGGAYIIGGKYEDSTPTTIWPLDILVFGNPFPCAPVPKFEWSAGPSSCLSADILFADKSAYPWLISSWTWDFGDGQSSSLASPLHKYDFGGTFSVTLTLTDVSGKVWSINSSVEVLLQPGCPPAIDPLPPRVVGLGQALLVCGVGHPAMGGSLKYGLDTLPKGAVFDSSTGCLVWTPARLETVVCLRFTVTELPGGLQASTCQYVRVVQPSQALDADMDGIEDQADNCPTSANHSQADSDRDGVGDACDATGSAVTPGQGAPVGAAGVADIDSDGHLDTVDNCPLRANFGQDDVDDDQTGDACDPDLDGDGVANAGHAGAHLDNCPWDPNADQTDANGNGVGDACDLEGRPTDRLAPGASADPQAYPAAGLAFGPFVLLLVASATVRRRAFV